MPIQQGMNQQTPAIINTIRQGLKSTARRVVRRTVKRAASKVARKVARKVGGKLKFGSPAWQKKYRVGKYAKKK